MLQRNIQWEVGAYTMTAAKRDKPWLIRTYAGHSTAAKSNELYRTNLARGQTGLSVAFDLPTQTGYDSDHPLAKGEVGKVGVPICHLGDMRTLFDGIPLDRMNTSMTINAPAAWLLSLYISTAEAQGVERAKLQGTTQNDIIKEYLSRGTYIFPPEPSLRLTADTIGFTYREVPKWNPMNVCSYHLQEAGATPMQELAFALANAIAVLDAVRSRGQVPEADFPQVVGRISFFVNAGIRFITEICKMRAFAELWDELTRTRYGVADAKQRLFRYGVQVNSLGLTEQQPENNVYRILLEMLAVVMSKNARARSVQLPAWNEALGLPRPWDQQWSLRLQQIVAFETDLLEYADIFDGSIEIAKKVESLKQEALAEMQRIADLGGAVAAIESAYMKQRLVESNLKRLAAIEAGEQTVVGVNAFTEGDPSPLSAGEGAILTVDASVERDQIERLNAWRAARDGGAVKTALAELAAAAKEDRNVMPASIACAQAGVTTGEWTQTLREVFGEYRAPTGVARAAGVSDTRLDAARREVETVSRRLGRRIKILVGKPGLDGHSNGAEQIAVRARDCGMEVVYEGIRLTPERIVNAALEESVHVVGLSILSGGHVSLVNDVLEGMRLAGIGDVPVVVGGIIPPADAEALIAAGVARVYTPKDFDLTQIMRDIVAVVDGAWKEAA
ncbi:(R)-ethylmalonyl-CoA mutase [Enhydrobacter aerosaccus]|uniref:(R)-ethylmalonyl-CoA mutase n=2 Tax=Enhydrobacter aerosaccus TaxID=225324 RepID=A0A1T4T527_9HYPH|nr:(R)-ethylmalonyl-CoA mutase [Enhydrobacter aerosaccus]